jgi:hypothetical protein
MIVRTKIMREIAGIGDKNPLIVPAQQGSMNCITGERRKQEDLLSQEKKP